MPDIGTSKDALRAVIPLVGEFVGTTDTQVLENKTVNATDNTITDDSTAAGDILKGNGTKFVRLPIGTAGQPLKVNAGATDLEYGTLSVIGGGTGATTLTGIVKASGTSAFTAVSAPTGAILGDSDTQNVSGLKTFSNQRLALRNPANTFTTTITNPAVAADRELIIPTITATDTLAVLGLAQTFTGVKSFTNPVQLNYEDWTKVSAPSDPGAEVGRLYFKTIDANNNGLFIKCKKAGAIVEVQIA